MRSGFDHVRDRINVRLLRVLPHRVSSAQALSGTTFRCLLIAGVLLPLTGGCSHPAIPDLTRVLPVQGTLTYKGLPVEGALLTFYSEDSDEAGFCWSETAGRFAVMTNDTAGIFPGKYLVTVSHPQGGVPEQYSDPERTPLWISVEEGQEQDLSITLED